MKIPKVLPSRKLLEDLLVYIDMSNSDLAELCQIDIRTVFRWLAGHSPVPAAMIRLLQLVAMTKTYDRKEEPMFGWEPKAGWRR